MKKIFISSFHPLISRNILQTGILDLLIKEDFKIYIFTYDYKLKFFESEFKKENVEIIGIQRKKFNTFENIMRQLGSSLLATSTIVLNRKERFLKDRRFFKYIISVVFFKIFSKSTFVKKIYRILFFKFYNQNIFYKYLKDINPDMVFYTDIFNDDDIRLMAEAKKMNKKIIGMVRSWDNATNKIILPIIGDKIMVHNHNIKKELEVFHNVKSDNIYISGIPQYDYFLNYKPKDENHFFKRTGFSKDRKIIMFAPTGKKFIDSDFDQLQVLHDAILKGEIKYNPQIIVRFPPGDIMDTDNLILSDKVNIYFDKPGVDFNSGITKDREMDRSDMYWMSDSLYYTDILVSAGSTLCIDICAFDKPIVCPKFDGIGIYTYFRSVRKMYDKFHYKYLIESNACKIPENKEEFIRHINTYLDNSEIDSEQRKKLLLDQCYKFDGLSCTRIVNYIKNNIKS